MRILQVNNKIIGTGAENVMRTLGESLMQKGNEVYYLVYENTNYPNAFTLKSYYYPFLNSIKKLDNIKETNKMQIKDPNHSIFKKISINLRNFAPKDYIAQKHAEKFIDNLKPDIIHFHNVLPHFTPIIKASSKEDIPIITTLHGYWPICPLSNLMRMDCTVCSSNNWDLCEKYCTLPFANVKKYMKKIKKTFDDHIDIIIPVSQFVKKRLENFNYNSSNIKVIHNGIDTSFYKPKGEKKLVALYLGRKSIHKGTHIFLKVAKLMKNNMPNIKFKMTGTKSASYDNLSIEKWVPFEKLPELYSSSLCLIFPSIWPEPFPLVNLESMACGTPVIASNLGGAPEAVINNKTGFIVDMNDKKRIINQIINKIYILYNDESNRNKLSKNAREHIINNFELKKMVKKYIDIYKQY